jgi:hypothetical protein
VRSVIGNPHKAVSNQHDSYQPSAISRQRSAVSKNAVSGQLSAVSKIKEPSTASTRKLLTINMALMANYS